MATAKENLEHQLGKGNADAIEAFVDEKLGQGSEQLVGLRQEVADLREQVKDVPDLRERVNRAAAILAGNGGAIDSHNELLIRRHAGEPVSEEEIAEDRARIDEVREEVQGVSGDVAERLGRLEVMSAAREGSERANRFEDIEADVAGLRASVDQLETRTREHEGVIASAFASARATLDGANAMRRAALFGLVAFVISFLLYFLIWLLTSMDWEWDNAIGVPAVIAGIVAAIVFLREYGDDENEQMSYEQAATIVRAENRPNDQREDDQEDVVVRERRPNGASASANARAGAR